MAIIIFLSLLGVCLVVLGVLALAEKKKRWTREVMNGGDGIKSWRQRLNQLTDRFVGLGAEPMLARAVSTTSDPYLNGFRGQTLAKYRELKGAYKALTFGYNAIAQVVKKAEFLLTQKGAVQALTIKRAAQAAEGPVMIKEVNPALFALALPREAPRPPLFTPAYLLDACERLVATINNLVQAINEVPGKVESRLSAVATTMAQMNEENAKLTLDGVKYGPYETRVASIDLQIAQIRAMIEVDPLGALSQVPELEKQVGTLKNELNGAAQMIAALAHSSSELAQAREWVAKVRATQVSCPWSEATSEKSTTWKLTTTDSNPDPLFLQAETLAQQAITSLAAGNFHAATLEKKHADASCQQALKLVKDLIERKNAIDEQVPRVRAELTALTAEVNATIGSGAAPEMAALVFRACDAVEERINEIAALYGEQKFAEAAMLLSGTQGTEHGMPIAKLLAQANELCRLLKQASEVAGSVKAQLEPAARRTVKKSA